jgi:hypothetical protein
MDSVKYIGMGVLKEAISIAVLNSSGKLVMECVIETKSSAIRQFFQGLRGSLYVTLEEGAWAAPFSDHGGLQLRRSRFYDALPRDQVHQTFGEMASPGCNHENWWIRHDVSSSADSRQRGRRGRRSRFRKQTRTFGRTPTGRINGTSVL